MLLSGDVGGTKTALAIFDVDEGALIVRHPVLERVFPSQQYQSLDLIIEEFLRDSGIAISAASFGVAGPVVGGRAEVTNLHWQIDPDDMRQRFGFDVHLMNDLEALASAVPFLEQTDLITINEGTPDERGAIGVIAPGTGLGESYLVWNRAAGRYEAHPSEGGHCAFGPMTPLQLEMLNYWMPRIGHVSYERVCSGMGLPNIYTFLRETDRYPEPDWLKEQLSSAGDMTPVIVKAAVAGEAPICVATLELFMEILGDQAGNLALTVLATGGIYLGGGIPSRILPQLQKGPFMTFFRDKGRFTEMMSRIPVHIIYNPKAALYGAAYDALALSSS
ncbi:MAG TPA: glucokinase [Promineifilum sp.]|nr:glucokinase [Promineifilum sp.]